jgi:hypothetical protein
MLPEAPQGLQPQYGSVSPEHSSAVYRLQNLRIEMIRRRSCEVLYKRMQGQSSSGSLLNLKHNKVSGLSTAAVMGSDGLRCRAPQERDRQSLAKPWAHPKLHYSDGKLFCRSRALGS